MLKIEKEFIEDGNLTVYVLKLDDGQEFALHEGEFETLKKYITKDLVPSSKTITLKFDSAINLEELIDNLYYELDRETKYTIKDNKLVLETGIEFSFDTLDKALEELDIDCCDYEIENVKFNY